VTRPFGDGALDEKWEIFKGDMTVSDSIVREEPPRAPEPLVLFVGSTG
jgi:hypothetical protein